MDYGITSRDTIRNFGEDVHRLNDVLPFVSMKDTEKLVGTVEDGITFEAVADIAKNLAYGRLYCLTGTVCQVSLLTLTPCRQPRQN